MKLFTDIKTKLIILIFAIISLSYTAQARDSLAALRADMEATETDLQTQITVLQEGGTGAIQYNIGDTGPAGGIVFYVTGNGMHGLEAAPEDQDGGTGVIWNNRRLFTQTSAVKKGINDGSFNTDLIIINQGEGSYAALVSANYNGGGYENWYLPSKDELNLIYNNLYLTGLVSFANDPYWSSSEQNNSSAWGQLFSSGYQTNYGKGKNNNRVRAIRAF